MSDKKTVSVEQVQKSLDALQNVAKGHSSRGTNSTEVVSMTGQGGATQVYHTPSNSDPGSWAGSVSRDVPENGASDAVDANGTDYNGGAQMVKSVLDKVAKGLPLTAAEFEVLKSVTEKGMNFGKDKDDDKDVEKAVAKDDKPEEDKKEGMPFGKSIESDETVAEGFEVSDFLKAFGTAICKSLDAVAARVSKIDSRLSAYEADQGNFQKSLANALNDVGQTVVLTAQRMDQIEAAPARGAKAVQGAPFAKGSYDGSNPASDVLSKALSGDYHAKEMVGEILADLVVKGQVQPLDVVRFNTTGELSPILQKKVATSLVGV